MAQMRQWLHLLGREGPVIPWVCQHGRRYLLYRVLHDHLTLDALKRRLVPMPQACQCWALQCWALAGKSEGFPAFTAYIKHCTLLPLCYRRVGAEHVVIVTWPTNWRWYTRALRSTPVPGMLDIPCAPNHTRYATGVSVLGPVVIGAGCKVGAGSVVVSDVPVSVGVPPAVISGTSRATACLTCTQAWATTWTLSSRSPRCVMHISGKWSRVPPMPRSAL